MLNPNKSVIKSFIRKSSKYLSTLELRTLIQTENIIDIFIKLIQRAQVYGKFWSWCLNCNVHKFIGSLYEYDIAWSKCTQTIFLFSRDWKKYLLEKFTVPETIILDLLCNYVTMSWKFFFSLFSFFGVIWIYDCKDNQVFEWNP